MRLYPWAEGLSQNRGSQARCNALPLCALRFALNRFALCCEDVAMSTLAINLPTAALAELCRRWKISELAIFGSATRANFRPDSDLDLLATFEPGARWGLLDHEALRLELADLLGRDVDLISRRALEHSQNWIRRDAILSSAHVIYSASEASDAPR